MAPVPYRLWAPLLLAFVFLASDNKGAELKGFQVIRQNGPWISPRGDSDTAVSCTALEKLVGQLEMEKQETTTLNSQLENEVSVLRKDLTHLRTQVATCGSSGSPAHQIQVQKKMKQYLETFDGETFLILKILSLTREVMRLQMKLNRALNSTDASKSQTVSVLQKEVKDKTAELDALKRQLQGLQGKDLSQIYQIILLQNRIWNVDQLGGAQAKSELTALQSQLDAKLRQLQSKDAAAAMLELISVQGKIGRVEQLMSTYIEESRDNYAAREIFRLQSEVDEAQKMMNSSESALQTLLQAREEELSKAQAEVKGKSAATDKNTHSVEHTPGWAFSSSQNCGESCRPRRKPPTSVSRLSDQRPEDPSSTFDFWFPPSPETQAEFDQAVAALTRKGESETADALRISFLQNQVDHLQQILSDHQTLEPAYINQLKKDLLATKTQLQGYVGELTEKNRTNAKLILKVTDLHNQLRTLEKERSSDRATSSLTVTQLREQLREILEAQSVDQAKIEALQDKVAKCARVEEEAEELETRLSVQVETCLGPAQTYQPLLRRTLEKRDRAGSGDISGKEFQDMLKAVLAETGGSETTKLILKIISLQDEARQLQRELTPGLQAEQKTRITKELKGKFTELRKSKETLMELLPTDAGQILSAADLFLRLRRVSKDGQKEKDVVSDLRKQLDGKEAEQERDRAEIQRLQEQLNTTEAKCSSVEAEVKGLQGDLQAKMEELQSKSDTVTSLALQVSTLTQQVADLDRRLQQSVPEASVKDLESKVEEFQQQIKDKTQMMDSSNVRVSDLTVEIMELHRGIAAMKDQISRLEEENANKVKGLTKRLELSQRKLKDAELLFQEANSKYSEMVMEIIDVKEQLKKAQALASKVAEKPQDPGLEQEIETLKKENRRLETASADLKQQVQEHECLLRRLQQPV
ncbi:unnamed protein product [Tetraodon nigroviridis]|uniref:(spotted green pufferfish) hypothetical protein n=1 Tax=Tetraodon nigroviridis TaxID=99883 RepID=Q4SNS2_TETNG|nr:unnamed protein product [Tetraodon nigroviridis]